jgi:hypothetical protein
MVTPLSIGGRSRIDIDLRRRFEPRVVAIAARFPVLIPFAPTNGRERPDYSARIGDCLGCDGRETRRLHAGYNYLEKRFSALLAGFQNSR